MLILGLNMFHAGASAAIIQDGEVIFAVAEVRLNRTALSWIPFARNQSLPRCRRRKNQRR